ncbi:MAG: 2-amino-4-hydroxy-6-hydroxymethyldihydropteridine diphosphokinase [Fluviicola sp.]|jgi:2-amino-4-hydroxy-6-hydroxymethyldihydropteridine diphosphokinase
MNTAVLSIGSNIGERLQWIRKAYQLLKEAGVHPTSDSSVYESEAWGFKSENSFYNTAIIAETSLSPEELLDQIHRIEHVLGRQRTENGLYSSRNIDIDIIFFNQIVIHNPNLHVPHPLLQDRNFVLAPLNEVIPDFIHPVLNLPIHTLYQQSNDRIKAFVVHSPLLNRQ